MLTGLLILLLIIIYSFKFKEKITGEKGDDDTRNVEIMVLLKFLSNFWITLEMSLINCEINLILIWFPNCVILSTDVANWGTTSAITDTKLYVLIEILSTQVNA